MVWWCCRFGVVSVPYVVDGMEDDGIVSSTTVTTSTSSTSKKKKKQETTRSLNRWGSGCAIRKGHHRFFFSKSLPLLMFGFFFSSIMIFSNLLMMMMTSSSSSSSSFWSFQLSSSGPPPAAAAVVLFASAASSSSSSSSLTSLEPDEGHQVLDELSTMLGMDINDMKNRVGIVFDFMDVDKNGELSQDEIQNWITNVKNEVQNKHVRVEMQTIDKDGNGKVTFEEMQKAYADADGDAAASQETVNELHKRFLAVDKDQDDALSEEEIRMLMNPGRVPELMKLEVDEILAAQDKDNDRKISLAEFMLTDEKLSPEDVKQYETEFLTYDLNKDGFIDEEEIKYVVAEPHRQEVLEAVDEMNKLAVDGAKLTKQYWEDKFHKFVISPATDNGELLRFPNEYNLSLPFADIPKKEAEERELEEEPMAHEEL